MAIEKKTEGLVSPPREVKVIDEHDEELDIMLAMAQASPRKRFVKLLHTLGEHENRLLNAMMPESYIQPYKQDNFHQTETVQAIRGIFNVVIFNDDGEIADSILVTGRKIVSVPPGTLHTYIARTPCIIYETTGQPERGYYEDAHENFPEWVPKEGTKEAVSYLEELKLKIGYLNETVDK